MDNRTVSAGKYHSDWLLVMAVGVAIMLWQYHLPGLTMDGVTYLQIVRNLLSGEGPGWQALWASPGYSLLVAAVAFLTGKRDLLAVAAVTGVAIYLVMLPLVYGFARTLFDRRTALAATLITAVSPHVLTLVFFPEPEVLFTCLLLAALFLAYGAVKRRSYLLALFAGVAFALTWLARSEGLLVMLFTLAALLLSEWRRWRESRVIVVCLLTVIAFLITATPYLIYLHKHYGALVFSPKASYVMIWMKVGYGDSKKEELHNDELWGLTADGKLRWQEPKGVGQLLSYLLADPARTARVYMRNLSREIPGRIPNNSGMGKFPQVLPVYLALAALAGAIAAGGSDPWRKRAVLLAPLGILLVLPVFTPGWWKYLLPYLPLVVILAARGGSAAVDWLCARQQQLSCRTALLVFVCLVMLVAGRFLWPLLPVQKTAPVAANQSRQQLADEQKKAGDWAIKTFGRGYRYSLLWSKLVYYLDGYWVAAPIADYSAQLLYFWRNKVEYVVTEVAGDDSTTELASYLTPPPGMELVGMYKSPDISYAVIFYRVNRPNTM